MPRTCAKIIDKALERDGQPDIVEAPRTADENAARVEIQMSDKRDRTNRRRERPVFDDDHPSYPATMPLQPPPLIARGPELDATVKRFNAEKGFGFVALADGSPDAFLHVTKLSGNSVLPGTRLRVRVGSSPRGAEVTEVLSIEAAPQVQGAVKWFDAAKGFGFITPDDGGKDIFISRRIIKQAGLSDLNEGQRVEVEIAAATKGPEAHTIRIVSGQA